MDVKMRETLTILGSLSDDSLATPLTKAVRGFLQKRPDATDDDTRRFVHELRDLAVYSGGANGFVMGVFLVLVGSKRTFPPPCGGDTSKIGEWLAQWE